jgi:hypothetical protein
MNLLRTTFLPILALALSTASAFADQPPDAGQPSDLPALIRDTQKQGGVPGKLRLIWWIPEEFWRLSFGQGTSLTRDAQESFLGAVRPYLIVAAVDGRLGPLGGVEFLDQESLRRNLKVVDSKGAIYEPLPEELVSADVKNLSTILKAMFGNMLGPMGGGLHLFFFPATGRDGTAIAAATREGSFAVKLSEESFLWRLPLGSLIPPKICPVDNEKLNGAWKFCPWHGIALGPSDTTGRGAESRPIEAPSPAPTPPPSAVIPDAESTGLLELVSLAPEAGSAVGRDTVVSATIRYEIANFSGRKGRYWVSIQFQHAGNRTSSLSTGPEAKAAVEEAAGTVHIEYPLHRVWDNPAVRRPFVVSFYLHERSSRKKSVVLFATEELGFPVRE